MNRETVFGGGRVHRSVLWREFDLANRDRYLNVIGLNPSTADETRDDPTIRRCIGFAKAWGSGALCMTNAYAYRATKPADMFAALDPVGAFNDHWLLECAGAASMALAAWGSNILPARRAQLCCLFRDISVNCLGVTASGEPRHPLYIRADMRPQVWLPIEQLAQTG